MVRTLRNLRWVVALAALLALIGLAISNGHGSASAEKWPVPGQTVTTLQPVVQYRALSVTPGFHNTTFYSCTVDGRQANVYFRYEILATSNGLDIEHLDYHTSPNFLANAFRVDLETSPNYYTEISASGGNFGNSSTSLDDVPADWSWYELDDDFTLFSNSDSPAIRARFYGVGQGASTTNCSDYRAIE